MSVARVVGKKNRQMDAFDQHLVSDACRSATIETALRRAPIICARNSWVSGNPSLSYKSRAQQQARQARFDRL
jgi:hypothetical protein